MVFGRTTKTRKEQQFRCAQMHNIQSLTFTEHQHNGPNAPDICVCLPFLIFLCDPKQLLYLSNTNVVVNLLACVPTNRIQF